MTLQRETIHGMVDFDTDTWFVIEREDRFWDIRRKAVSITYFEKYHNFDEFVKFLKEKERSIL